MQGPTPRCLIAHGQGRHILTLEHTRKPMITWKQQVKALNQEETGELVCLRKSAEMMKGGAIGNPDLEGITR